MDGGVSTAAIEVLVQNMINLFKDEYSLRQGLDEEAQQLQTTLAMIQGYLSDAEKKSIAHDAVKAWLRELEAKAFDADNVLDEVSYHLLHKKVKKMKTPKDKVLSRFSSFDHFARPRNMALRIKEINTAFDAMNKRATDLGLQSIVVNAPAAALNASLETDSVTLDPIFIGRDDDVPKLVEKLTEARPEERIFSILAIVGMGGMGKTTLTRKVFNHHKIKAQFGSHLWIHVSQTFDPIILFKKILSTLTSDSTDGGVEDREVILKKLQKGFKSDGGVESRDVILKNLREAFKSKTYLLILDDVWNEDLSKWEDFINAIWGATSTKGNGIIITTRSQKVASIVNPLEVHTLNGLSDEDCWLIIKAKTFGNGDVPLGFEMIGRKIAKRCQGLPLAANVVGGVLRSKSEQEWSSINEKWLSDGKGGENISKILKLSFDHLNSPSIKKCFAYCSIFPKGEKIVKQELIELWMAEGFLQGDERNDDMESVGDKIINVLLHNSLLQVAKRDDYGNVENCVMHDLVQDMACSVLSSSNSDANGITPVRYMILKDKACRIPKQVAKRVRTLIFEGKTSGNIFADILESQISPNMADMESLHVLTLSGHYSWLSNSIRKLIHLRNLNVSRTWIKNLPEWISELHHLQTLRMGRDVKLPSTLKYLINLRHLYIEEGVELPAHIGRLTCLQTLRYFRVGKEKGYQIEELGSLKNLKGNLEIRNLEKVHDKDEALKANIFQKPNLIDLKFVWDADREGENNDESVLEGLQPHPNLKKLGIQGFKGRRFPLWMVVRDGSQGSGLPLNNLIELTLSSCSECQDFSTLEHLSNLKNLYLFGLRLLESLPDWLFHKNKSLAKLDISGCPRLRELPDGMDTLNSLEELTIKNCDNLMTMGSPSGHESQGILRSLRIVGCQELMELPREMLDSWAPSLETLELKDLPTLWNLLVVLNCLAESSTCLTTLEIVGVPKFMMASVERWDLGKLGRLEIDVSVEASSETSAGIKDSVDTIFQGCSHSLTHLSFRGREDWDWVPASIQHLPALDWLTLTNVGVEELPQWVGNLSSLSYLWLKSCKKLRRLPSPDALERLTKLRVLDIKDCPELHIDSEWRNKPHLIILVDGRYISESDSKTSTKSCGCRSWCLFCILLSLFFCGCRTSCGRRIGDYLRNDE